ncbi:MAG: hypothetical protein AABX01_02880 [Candidatus Micrarchaeota archaeon]
MVPRDRPFPPNWHSHLPAIHKMAIENMIDMLHTHPGVSDEARKRVPLGMHGIKNRGELESALREIHRCFDRIKNPEISGMGKGLVRAEAFVRNLQRSDFAPPRGKPVRHKGE